LESAHVRGIGSTEYEAVATDKVEFPQSYAKGRDMMREAIIVNRNTIENRNRNFVRKGSYRCREMDRGGWGWGRPHRVTESLAKEHA
jgi:hypothetical protein